MQVATSERWAELPLEGAADRGTSISLKTKILPTEEWWTPEHSYIPWCASYGPVDIAPLLARIASEDAGVWEDAAQVSAAQAAFEEPAAGAAWRCAASSRS